MEVNFEFVSNNTILKLHVLTIYILESKKRKGSNNVPQTI